YEPGRQGLGTAHLGLAAAVGFVCGILAVLVRSVRSADRRGWSFEARLGVITVAALFLATRGGISRALELTGLSGVRAWSRIAIVVTFAGIVVFARLLDRLRVVMHGRLRTAPRIAWPSLLAIVLVVGVLDQASPVMVPKPEARARLWRADDAFVASLERQLPENAMVFQLPVVDFPDHGAIRQLSAHDLIKEGYLHSKTLRWSAGGVRGREGEWQWPASRLPVRELTRGVTAMGFSALMLDRYGYADDGTRQYRQLKRLLGTPIAERGDRLAAWDLRSAVPSLLGDLGSAGRRRLAQRLLDAPRVYLSSDADPIVGRGEPRGICAHGFISLANPGRRRIESQLEITFDPRNSTARHGYMLINGVRRPISTDPRVNRIPVHLAPGTNKATITVRTPGLRCASAPVDALPAVSMRLRPIPGSVS
ncbi:MAG: hypothetical protein ACXW1M_09505, partial [Acidimicrobiia bacterium]